MGIARTSAHPVAACTLAFLLVGAAAGAGCGRTAAPRTDGETGGDTAGGSGDPSVVFSGTEGEDGTTRACEGLECKRVSCSGDTVTSVSGVVTDPSGSVPLYNAIVYVPKGEVAPFTEGVSCDRCASAPSGKPMATAVTNSKGEFVLRDVPVVTDFPLVVQVGRWRRQVTVRAESKCADTKLDGSVTRLPRSKAEGDIPRIALTTGGADSLECFLRKLGIAESEFTNPDGTGRVHLYRGLHRFSAYQARVNVSGQMRWVDVQSCSPVNGTSCRIERRNWDGARINNQTPPATMLWGSTAPKTVEQGLPNEASWPASENRLSNYDMVILSCEGAENQITKDAAAKDALRSYLDSGGRVFASHFHYDWYKNPGANPLRTTATWVNNESVGDKTVTIDESFPKGKALSEWLGHVGATNAPGKVPMTELRKNVTAVHAGAQRWIYDSADLDAPKFYSFNTPLGADAEAQCGRAVYTDIHVSSGDGSGGEFPGNCTTKGMTPQEKALLFLLFDLSACVQPDSSPVTPPPVIR
jgi:hypothetical protein